MLQENSHDVLITLMLNVSKCFCFYQEQCLLETNSSPFMAASPIRERATSRGGGGRRRRMTEEFTTFGFGRSSSPSSGTYLYDVYRGEEEGVPKKLLE